MPNDEALMAAKPTGDSLPRGQGAGFDLFDYIPFRLVQTQLKMHRSLKPESTKEAVALADLSQTEFRILCLVHAKPASTPSAIAEDHGFDRAMVARTLATLVDKEMVTTRPLQSDQRSKSVHLTEKAVEYLSITTRTMREYGEFLETVLADGEKATLFALLDKLVLANSEYESARDD